MEIRINIKTVVFMVVLTLTGFNFGILNSGHANDSTYVPYWERYMQGFNPNTGLQTKAFILINAGDALSKYDLNYLKESLKGFDNPEASNARKYYSDELAKLKNYVGRFEKQLSDFKKSVFNKKEAKLTVNDLEAIALQLKIANEVLSSLFIYGNKDYDFKGEFDEAFNKIDKITASK